MCKIKLKLVAVVACATSTDWSAEDQGQKVDLLLPVKSHRSSCVTAAYNLRN